MNAVCCHKMYGVDVAMNEAEASLYGYLAARLDATITISAFRTWAALVIFRQLKAEKDEYDARMAGGRWASSTIQACRGHCGRIRAVAVRDEKRKVEGDVRRRLERPFFTANYGEIRWRDRKVWSSCPAALRQLEYFEASLECRYVRVLLRRMSSNRSFWWQRAKHVSERRRR